MKKLIVATVLSFVTATAASSAPTFVISNEVSHPSRCLNVINPVTGQYLRQAEIDTTDMMEYLTENGFEKVSKKRGPCQTTFSAKHDAAHVVFVFSTLSGEFVGLDATKFEAGAVLPKIDGINF
ncbi:hypothetical protein [Sulfitobacter sp. R18_1]|uniref:hypothetical protein n=1 Tax=Sulfitobacter sp. R18_1 TaxID=2821104 RepID=UPI001ADCC0C8|nr:hypothetical protein [Sulfitobacter sp. R18_1]MBO9428010.1 hypothetical protein [Sulfitobacter sp. R18_1]